MKPVRVRQVLVQGERDTTRSAADGFDGATVPKLQGRQNLRLRKTRNMKRCTDDDEECLRRASYADDVSFERHRSAVDSTVENRNTRTVNPVKVGLRFEQLARPTLNFRGTDDFEDERRPHHISQSLGNSVAEGSARAVEEGRAVREADLEHLCRPAGLCSPDAEPSVDAVHQNAHLRVADRSIWNRYTSRNAEGAQAQ